MIGRAAAEDLFDPGRPRPPYDNSVLTRFIYSQAIILVALVLEPPLGLNIDTLFVRPTKLMAEYHSFGRKYRC